MNQTNAPDGRLRTVDLLFAFSFAADMAFGLPAGHGARSAYIGMQFAKELELTSEERADLFYAELLTDVGCTAWTSQIAATILSDEIVARRELVIERDQRNARDMLGWLMRYMAAGQTLGTRARRLVDFCLHGKEFMHEAMLNSSEVAARIAGRLGGSFGVQDALRTIFERWDGSGPLGKTGESIPIVARIVQATIRLEVAHQADGRQAAEHLARNARARALDPAVVDVFLRLAQQESFWQGLEREPIWDQVRPLEPDSPRRFFDPLGLDDVARAFADFTDLKSFYSAGHSRRVASLVDPMSTYLELPAPEVAVVRRAAWLHDVGLVAVPSFVLHKPESRLTDAEWERLRLHPYYAERILSRVPEFDSVVPAVATHHERPDGHGYHRGLRGKDVPIGARLIAAADRFDELTHVGPERPALEPDDALVRMNAEVGERIDGQAFEALGWALGRSGEAIVASEERERQEDNRDWPAGLTNREVEVLRLLSTGASRRAMARELFVSEHTIHHHLDHIYGKIDVHTRVAATLFALENDLLD